MFGRLNKDSNFNSDSNSVYLKYTNENDIKKLSLEDIIIHISYLKKEDLIMRYYMGLLESNKIKGILDQLETTTKELRKQSEHEKKDLENIQQHSIKTVLQKKGKWDKEITEANSQYHKSLENFHKSEKELQNYKHRDNNNSNILEIFYKQILRLILSYEISEMQLKNIPEYNSTNSSQLIKLFKQLLSEQETFHLARNKWINARTLVIYSQTQIAFGIKKWEKILKENSTDEKDRYFVFTESKNNFMAAFQNIESCQIYIGNKIKFPFVTKNEISSAIQSLNIMFENVLDDKNAKKCLELLKEMHLKVTNLIQWFQNIISENIMKDLEDNCNKMVEIQEKLVEERKEIIFNKFGNINQKIINHEKEDWEKIIEKLKTEKFINLDVINIINLSKPSNYKSSNDFSISIQNEHKLISSIQEKINQFEVQKILLENKKKLVIKSQDKNLENVLHQRKISKSSYKFE